MVRLVIAALFAALVALPVNSAPGPKDTSKPEAPATPAQYMKSANNLKQVGLAIHNFHDVNGNFPPYYLTKDGKPGLSWRVALLPYIEEDGLFKQFKLDEPWDSDNNKKLIEKLPKVYAPVRGKAEAGQTFYQMFSGKVTVLDPDGKEIRFAQVTDGLSNTIMVVEGAKPVMWTKPDDIPYDGKTVPKLGGMFDGDFHALFGDGNLRRIPKGMDADVLKLLINRHDGQPVDFDGAIKKAQSKE
jgi:Protein of unknown function (DUF1559)